MKILSYALSAEQLEQAGEGICIYPSSYVLVFDDQAEAQRYKELLERLESQTSSTSNEMTDGSVDS